MNKNKGFTIIELMIVVSVIGLLATLVSIGVLKASRTAKVKQAESELAMMKTGILKMVNASGVWPNQASRPKPGSTEIWDLSTPQSGVIATDGSYNYWNGPYYEGAMVDPWGNNYFFDPDYRIDDRNYVVIGSFGPNGKGRNMYDDDDVVAILQSL